MSISRAPEDWRPRASLEALKTRARMLQRIRAFFSERGVLEVDTPALSGAATTDPHLASLTTLYTGPGAPQGRRLYLHTSPEFSMKRLLAAGSGSIYQLCKVFRDGEAGRLHNPEFTLLEWYRVGFDHRALIEEVAALVTHTLGDVRALAPTQIVSYRDAFLKHGLPDPHVATVTELEMSARQRNVPVPEKMPREETDPWCDLLLTHIVEPQLGRGGMTFVVDYPASQAALARIRRDTPPVAERFELYIEGIEIANGFHELGDAAEQRRRFEHALNWRRHAGLPDVPMDEHLLRALESGLPDCAGVALGFDRLVMLASNATAVGDVMAFPLERA